jgi:hypothetical protein
VARVEGLKVKDVRRALLETRTLVKTWTLRGTLHYIPATDVTLFGAAMTQAAVDRISILEKVYGGSRADFERLTEAIAQVLDATPRTREELAAAVEHLLPESLRFLLRSGWGSVLHPVAHAGLLCFGPAQGQNVTFVRVDAWTGLRLDDVSPDEAVATLARRYLHSYGPAAPADFARWTGLGPARAKEAFKSIAAETTQVQVAGRAAWILKKDAEALAASTLAGEVRLLPHFDVYTLGQADRDLTIAAEHRPKVYRRAAWISPVILVEGRIVGVWSMRKSELVLEPFGRMSRAHRRAALEEGDRLRAAL